MYREESSFQHYMSYSDTLTTSEVSEKHCVTEVPRTQPVPDMTYNVFGGTLYFTQRQPRTRRTAQNSNCARLRSHVRPAVVE